MLRWEKGGKKETVRDMYMDTNRSWNYRMPPNKRTGSTLDPTKFNHWQLQNFLRNYVGRKFGWHRPNYKMSLGKIMLAISIFSYFLTSDALDFVVLILNYFPSRKRLGSLFCSCKTLPCTEFCGCAPHALHFVPTKSLCTTPPPLSEPWSKNK